MATLCTHCGIPLKDGARFCNNCGTLVPSHPLSPPFSRSVPPLAKDDKPGVIRQEQATQQKAPHLTHYSNNTEPPSWMSQFDNELHYRSKVSSAGPAISNPREELKDQQVTELPTASLPIVSNSSASNLHVNISSHTPPPHVSVSSRKPRRNRKSLAVALISLVLLVLVAWIVLLHPFSVPDITQPQQSFKDTQLAVSLMYPSSWTSHIDRDKAAVYFYDSSHTGQVNIVVGSTSDDLNQYVQQQASRLGMSGQKAEPLLAFGGATWQQLQGIVQQKGASYTETLLVTMHHQRLYSMLLLAPQTTYAQEEQYIFAGMRSSFQFLI